MRKLKDNDIVFRAAVDPNFRGKKKGFDAKQFFYLAKTPGGFETSLVWQYMAPTMDYVHRFGERLADGLNQPGSPRRNVYCGCYAMTVGDIRSLVGMKNLDEIVAANVVHKIENGEIAHAALEVTVSRKDPNTLTAIVDRLWHIARGPIKFVCDCDMDLNSHPNELLQPPPNGEFNDARSLPRLAFDVVCFKIYREPKANGEMGRQS